MSRELTSAEINRRVLALKQIATAHFTQEDWVDVGLLTDCADMIENHGRLLRSMSFGDDDYGGHVGRVLGAIVRRDFANLLIVEDHTFSKYGEVGMDISSRTRPGRRIVFQPEVFEIPEAPVDRSLVAVMMPFTSSFAPVFDTVQAAASRAGMQATKADDIWVHSAVVQDIFSLIYRSHIVVCDFTDKNPNVFYEAGIAHTLGKHVIPITQVADHIPFDLRHHRYLSYLNNAEGRDRLGEELRKRFQTLSSVDPGSGPQR